jgi:hypothetical protein
MRNLIRALIAALSLIALPVVSQAGLFVGVSVNIAPPLLPVYVQPPCPAPGYIWIPGYWAWDDGYYWVPGTWALAPAVGLLWTPGYWGWAEGLYLWHAGYWGPHVGFYGGVNYGFGYGGVGYEGGYWRGREFYYNRSVTNINTTNITKVYNRTVINNVNVTRVSFNGGAGGVMARPTATETTAAHEPHFGLTPVQRQQQQLASGNASLRAGVNGGRPAIAATPRAGEFSGHGAVAARGAGQAGAAPVASHGAEHVGGAPHSTEQRPVPQAGAPRFDRPASAQHTPPAVHESAPVEQRPMAHAPQYAARSSPEHQGWPGTQYQGRPAPQYQPRSEPQYQPRPEPQNQPRQAPHYQPAAAPPQGGRAAPGAKRPERAGSPEHPGDHNSRG